MHEDGAHDVGFTVFRGHPYCEACHVKLRMPKCAGCSKSIREDVVEALDKKWHFECFNCDVSSPRALLCVYTDSRVWVQTCKNPFVDPSFFQRGDRAYCDGCYRILLKSEM